MPNIKIHQELDLEELLKRVRRERRQDDNRLIEKCAKEAERYGEEGYEAASAIRKFKTEEEA